MCVFADMLPLMVDSVFQRPCLPHSEFPVFAIVHGRQSVVTRESRVNSRWTVIRRAIIIVGTTPAPGVICQA